MTGARRVGAIAIVAAACGHAASSAPPAPAPHAAPAPPPVHAIGVCPAAIQIRGSAHLWAHALFPGCSPPPFSEMATEGVRCDGACPAPCRERDGEEGSDQGTTTTYTYADGDLARSHAVTSVGDTTSELTETCTYEHDQLVRCDAASGPVTVHRDGAGRIDRIDFDGDDDVVVSYDARGDATDLVFRDGLRHTVLTYDGEHRLLTEQDTFTRSPHGPYSLPAVSYQYDDQRHLVHGTKGDLTIAYDGATGLATEVIRRAVLGTGTTRITYDDHRRPRTIDFETRKDDASAPVGHHVTTFDYDCAGE